ncbi:hypothetical protein AB6A40_010890 [Gnathostoma spinigerum]|uniref:Peptidase S1 domain-containing protein n=1 Tax=Gnathostoma spinigerum TaxID=75299 RepID=A0ABD6EXW9_9BILA
MKLIPALFLIFQRYITVLAYLTKPPITTLTALNSTVLDKPNTIIRIIGGTEANETVWPWQVKIIYKRLNSMKYFLCGGSLITNKHVLSAAHCLESVFLVKICKTTVISAQTLLNCSNRNAELSQANCFL